MEVVADGFPIYQQFVEDARWQVNDAPHVPTTQLTDAGGSSEVVVEEVLQLKGSIRSERGNKGGVTDEAQDAADLFGSRTLLGELGLK